VGNYRPKAYIVPPNSLAGEKGLVWRVLAPSPHEPYPWLSSSGLELRPWASPRPRNIDFVLKPQNILNVIMQVILNFCPLLSLFVSYCGLHYEFVLCTLIVLYYIVRRVRTTRFVRCTRSIDAVSWSEWS